MSFAKIEAKTLFIQNSFNSYIHFTEEAGIDSKLPFI